MLRAKVKCVMVTQLKRDDGTVISEAVHFDAVYSADPATENYAFSQATPALNCAMTIDNPKAFGKFVEGREYFLDFVIHEPKVAAVPAA